MRARRVTSKPRAASDSEGSNVAKAAAVAGLIANPVVLVSEFYLKTTGEGLPPGPGGIYGATEGVSYLVVVGIVAWSLYKKAKTGSGLPGTLLGAAEGLSYLSILGGKTTRDEVITSTFAEYSAGDMSQESEDEPESVMLACRRAGRRLCHSRKRITARSDWSMRQKLCMSVVLGMQIVELSGIAGGGSRSSKFGCWDVT